MRHDNKSVVSVIFSRANYDAPQENREKGDILKAKRKSKLFHCLRLPTALQMNLQQALTEAKKQKMSIFCFLLSVFFVLFGFPFGFQ